MPAPDDPSQFEYLVHTDGSGLTIPDVGGYQILVHVDGAGLEVPADGNYEVVVIDLGPCDCCTITPCCDYLSWSDDTEICLVLTAGTGAWAALVGSTLRLQKDSLHGNVYGGFTNNYSGAGESIGYTGTPSDPPSSITQFSCLLVDGTYRWFLQYLSGFNPPRTTTTNAVTGCTGLLATFDLIGDPDGIDDPNYPDGTFTIKAYRVLSTDPCPPTMMFRPGPAAAELPTIDDVPCRFRGDVVTPCMGCGGNNPARHAYQCHNDEAEVDLCVPVPAVDVEFTADGIRSCRRCPFRTPLPPAE